MSNGWSFMPDDKAAQLTSELRARKRVLDADQAPRAPEYHQRPEPRRPLTAEEAQARRTQVRAQAIAEASKPELVSAWLTRCGVEVRFRRTVVDAGLIPVELRRWAMEFPDTLEGASVLLAGKPGGGKTVASVWLLEQVYRVAGRVVEDSSGLSASWVAPESRFVPASDLFAMCFDREERKPLEALERVQVLVVDDWGLPYESDWAMAQLDRLIDRRWARMLTTIVSTNLAPEGAENTFQVRYPRIYSRLCDAGGPGVVPIRRGDLRREKP